MKKFAFCFVMLASLMIGSIALATETTSSETGNIPSMSIEEYMIMNQSKQAKVDIIKKNNIEMEKLKNELKDEMLDELKELLQFLQDSKDTLEVDVERTLAEIEKILDLIATKGMQLEQYDKLIEKQNEVIVKMKNVMQTVEKI